MVSAEQLAEHEGLVRWVVSRQRLRGLSFEDAVQAGRIGLWRAIQGYDPQRGTRFSTYAVVAIRRAIWRAVAQHQCPSGDPDQRLPLASWAVDLPDPIERLHQAEVRAELSHLVGTLPRRLRQVVVAHYGLDGSPSQTFTVIGQALGVTRQRVQQLHVEALLWLAQPDRSLGLRELVDRGQRLDYQRILARQRHWRRTRRTSWSRSSRGQVR